ncbi:D-sedoheptulose 7-phosphate isomerase [Desulfurispira natronophila]|uniref:Phosphoheptose isomerase n=1 Tax=Desulfurispira natronophila TaxID=682562 RepID=A0A7W7Y320_9BACT|nr:D-sedoheptulose 7-phosphate isomerase [Desulfurispira natronophila]MBB5021142.1 D-sedoheptulose 7-phosphate isomerase [Desulfurispira natronophila]
MHNLEQQVQQQFEEQIALVRRVQEMAPDITRVAKVITHAVRQGNKVLTMGNGGSASDAMHMAGELIGRFMLERPSYPAIALCADNAAMTAIANDYGYEQVFSRQVEGLCRAGDIVFGISTSGNSLNVLLAMEEARRQGGTTISLSGRDGGKLAPLTDYSLVVPSLQTPRIQEMHITIIHILCQLVETALQNSD